MTVRGTSCLPILFSSGGSDGSDSSDGEMEGDEGHGPAIIFPCVMALPLKNCVEAASLRR